MISSLAGTVVYLFKTSRSTEIAALETNVAKHEAAITELRTQNGVLEADVSECRKDREDLRVMVGRLETRLEFVELRRAG